MLLNRVKGAFDAAAEQAGLVVDKTIEYREAEKVVAMIDSALTIIVGMGVSFIGFSGELQGPNKAGQIWKSFYYLLGGSLGSIFAVADRWSNENKLGSIKSSPLSYSELLAQLPGDDPMKAILVVMKETADSVISRLGEALGIFNEAGSPDAWIRAPSIAPRSSAIWMDFYRGELFMFVLFLQSFLTNQPTIFSSNHFY